MESDQRSPLGELKLYWEDFVVERRVADAELAAAVAEVFGVPVSGIAFGTVPGDLFGREVSQIDMAILRSPVGGDFARWVTLMPMRERPREGMPRLIRLAQALRSPCLTPGYLVEEGWLLVHPDGRVESVEVDEDAKDNDAYVIVGQRPSPPTSSTAS